MSIESTKQASKETEDADGSQDSCQHHWLIAPPSGPTSQGVCRFCGEERAFQNHQSATSSGDWRNSMS